MKSYDIDIYTYVDMIDIISKYRHHIEISTWYDPPKNGLIALRSATNCWYVVNVVGHMIKSHHIHIMWSHMIYFLCDVTHSYVVQVCSLLLLNRVDISYLYHYIRGQMSSYIKLYVIYNVLEVFDKLWYPPPPLPPSFPPQKNKNQ